MKFRYSRKIFRPAVSGISHQKLAPTSGRLAMARTIGLSKISGGRLATFPDDFNLFILPVINRNQNLVSRIIKRAESLQIGFQVIINSIDWL